MVSAEARGRRAGAIDKEVAEAQIKAAQQAIAEEKEVIHRHRLSADLLAQLSEKVRSVRQGGARQGVAPPVLAAGHDQVHLP